MLVLSQNSVILKFRIFLSDHIRHIIKSWAPFHSTTIDVPVSSKPAQRLFHGDPESDRMWPIEVRCSEGRSMTL